MLSKKIFIIILSFIALFLSPKLKLAASSDLDEIKEYNVTIDVRENGTLDILYEIRWVVLDSIKEGPLEWVKIGIPNRFVDEITALTDNIKKIKYYSDEGSYIRIDFDNKYYQGEEVYFEFKFHQNKIYHVENEMIYYDFSPGFFDSIKIDKATLKWNKKNVIDITSFLDEDENYYIYSMPLDYSETIHVNVKYNKESFPLFDGKDNFSSAYMLPQEKLLIIFIILLFVSMFVIIIIVSEKNRDHYLDYRGFTPIHFRYFFFHHPHAYVSSGGVDHKGAKIVNPQTMSTGTGSSHTGGCACACACACAGGGRAGCSKKDFYNLNLKTKKIIDNLEKKTN